VVAWGQYYNGSGFVPMFVPAGLTNVVAVAADDTHNLALKGDGTMVAWGYGPTNVPAELTNVVAIATGEECNMALKAGGTVAVWGNNYYGQTNVPANLTNVVAIASGRWHCLALKSDGKVTAWGQYYDGTYYQTMTVPAGLSNVVTIAAGEWTSVALLGNGPPPETVLVSNPMCTSNGFCLSLPTRNGRVYRLEYLNALTGTNWIPLPLVAGNGGVQTLIDPAVPSAQRFYRVRRW
jgi:hypothetical protein